MSMETWKVVYVPKVLNGGVRGVALVEGKRFFVQLV